MSGDIVVRRTRRLPIKGEVLVKEGTAVKPSDVVARALLPGPLQTIKLAEKLGIEAKDVPGVFKQKVGDKLQKGEIIAETKGFFGLFGKQTIVSDFTGTVETISEVTGSILVREAPIPVEVDAYIQGSIAEVLAEEGAIVETRCALVQGIFGVGGERTGKVRVAVEKPSDVLDAALITASDKDTIIVGGAGITHAAILKAIEVGATGLIAGGVKDGDLTKVLGYDIGVAITGQEQIGLTIMVTEGFGYLQMADRTFALLKSLAGQAASINGATQIRAGVIRPEIIVPHTANTPSHKVAADAFELKVGTPIRAIREPYFGRIGTVTGLPATLKVVESGTEVRVLNARLDDGQEVTIPRANVEIIAVG